VEPRDRRKVVDHAGRDQHKARALASAVSQADVEAVAHAPDAGHTYGSYFDAIGREFGSADRVQFGGIDTVAGQVAVQRTRAAIARRAQVAEEHAAPAASEHQSSTHSGRPASNDDH